nr:MAG TPA: hypothetical protein [Caudoviricetes sp.]
MKDFNQAEFESKAKKLVAKHLNYKVNEEDMSIVWFSKVGVNAKVIIHDLDDHCFEITYCGEDGEYIVDVYDIVECDKSDEEDSDGESIDKSPTSGD